MFIVIVSSLVVNTVVSKGPIIFLTLAQSNVGEYDGYLTYTRWSNNDDLNSYSQMRDFLNYTRVRELYGDEYNLSPRFHFCDVHVTGSDADQTNEGCVMMMDLEREKEIGLAVNFPVEALEPGQVVLPEFWRTEYGYAVGDAISLSFESRDLWNTITLSYNELAEEAGWPVAPALTDDSVTT